MSEKLSPAKILDESWAQVTEESLASNRRKLQFLPVIASIRETSTIFHSVVLFSSKGVWISEKILYREELVGTTLAGL